MAKKAHTSNKLLICLNDIKQLLRKTVENLKDHFIHWNSRFKKKTCQKYQIWVVIEGGQWQDCDHPLLPWWSLSFQSPWWKSQSWAPAQTPVHPQSPPWWVVSAAYLSTHQHRAHKFRSQLISSRKCMKTFTSKFKKAEFSLFCFFFSFNIFLHLHLSAATNLLSHSGMLTSGVVVNRKWQSEKQTNESSCEVNMCVSTYRWTLGTSVGIWRVCLPLHSWGLSLTCSTVQLHTCFEVTSFPLVWLPM